MMGLKGINHKKGGEEGAHPTLFGLITISGIEATHSYL